MTIRSLRTIAPGRPLPALLDVAGATIVPAPSAVIVAAPYAPSGGLMVGSSETSTLIATGNQTFALDQFGIGFTAGQRVRIASHSDPVNTWMEGAVLSYIEPLLTVAVDMTGSGIGTHADWSIGITGMKGTTGNVGPQGPIGLTGPVPEAPTDGQNYTRKSSGWNNADALYATIASPHFSGVPTAPTPAGASNDGTLATTAFVHAATGSAVTEAPSTGVNFARRSGVWNDIDAIFATKAPLASPVLSGDPQSVTQPKADSDNSIATTGFVHAVTADYALLAGATFTGTVSGPTPAPGDATTKLATTGFVTASFAPLLSPVFLGTPSAPSPVGGSNDGSLATTLWVRNTIAATGASYAPLASPAFVGNPTAPTSARGDADTSLATTAFVADAILAAGTGTGLADAPNDGRAYGRLSGTWTHTIPERGASNNLATVEASATLAAPVLGGYKDSAASPAVAFFQISAKWLSTPDGSGNNCDSAAVRLLGTSYTTNPDSVQLLAGNNAIGFKSATFKASTGCLGLPNDPVDPLDAVTKQYADNGVFPSGTVMLFCQAAAPLGWTKSTTHNDKALRVTNGTTGGTGGGTNSFSSVMAQTVTGNHTLAASEIPNIQTSVTCYPNGNNGYYVPMNPNSGWGVIKTANTGGYYAAFPANNTTGVTYTNAFTGVNNSGNTGGGAHSHPMTMAMQYVDVMLASKD